MFKATQSHLAIAKDLLRSYEIAALQRLGFSQDLSRYCYSATYPPLKACHAISQKDLLQEPYSGALNVYVHFPFCSGRCSFCHFNVLTHPKNSHVDNYLLAVTRELEMLSAVIYNAQATNLYLGGGTPSLLAPKHIAALLVQIDNFISLQHTPLRTLEIHPEIIHAGAKNYLTQIRNAGINRVSIGVQDFDAKVLSASQRRHSPEEAVAVIATAKDLGLLVNLDLLTPLPCQTETSWLCTLERAFSLQPDSLTLYTTSIRPSMPLYQDMQRGIPMPGAQDQILFYILAQLQATSAGYEEVVPRWFRRKAAHRSSSQFLAAALTQAHTLGIGCGAYGNLPDIQYYNAPRMQEYLDHVNNWNLPTWRGTKLNRQESLYRELVFSARNGCLLFAKFQTIFNTNIKRHLAKQIKFLIHHKLATLSADALMLTDKGKIFSDEIAVMFVSQSVQNTLQKETYLNDPQVYLFENLNHFYEL